MARTVTRTLAAVAVVGLTTFGVVGTADAAPVGCKPIKGQPNYPPGQCKPKGISPGSASPGDSVSATSGEGQFTPGSRAGVVLHGPTGDTLGNVVANTLGEAVLTFNVPTGTTPGQYKVTFTGPFFGGTNGVSLNLKVTQALAGQGGGAGSGQGAGSGSGSGNGNVAGNGGGNSSGLPLTGFELGMASVLGLGLIGGGAGVVIASRRRREPATA